MMFGLLILFICGFVFFARRAKTDNKLLSREYLTGLNYLLNEEPDKAVAQFIKLLEVDNDLVETHLALGALFRRQGEVDKAIHIHQNLIARPNLSSANRIQALLALGQDYLQAGVYDRAEKLFNQVMVKDPHSTTSFHLLLNIYQQEKEWEKAIEIAQRLQNRSETMMNKEIAHFHCEIAEQCWQRNERERCYWHLRQALASDANSVRASLMQGDIEIGLGNYKSALYPLQQVEKQDFKFILLALPFLVTAYHQLDKAQELLNYLNNLYKHHPSWSILYYLVKEIEVQEGIFSALQLINEGLKNQPSLLGLQHWISLMEHSSNVQEKSALAFIHTILIQLGKDETSFQCEYCGIETKQLQWFCKGCNRWNFIKPKW